MAEIPPETRPDGFVLLTPDRPLMPEKRSTRLTIYPIPPKKKYHYPVCPAPCAGTTGAKKVKKKKKTLAFYLS
jgi:hypothetical protein